MDEGYIKFKCNWDKTIVDIDKSDIDNINYYRCRLIEMGLIGKIKGGPGFGNISFRLDNSNFMITGSNTGGVVTLTNHHLSKVNKVDIDSNTITCSGLIIASSESMSHAILYKTISAIKSIIHIHHNKMWQYYKNTLPTTNGNITYGTPEMAYAIKDKIDSNPNANTLVLGGHQDGIIVFGSSLKQCYGVIKQLFGNFM